MQTIYIVEVMGGQSRPLFTIHVFRHIHIFQNLNKAVFKAVI